MSALARERYIRQVSNNQSCLVLSNLSRADNSNRYKLDIDEILLICGDVLRCLARYVFVATFKLQANYLFEQILREFPYIYADHEHSVSCLINLQEIPLQFTVF